MTIGLRVKASTYIPDQSSTSVIMHHATLNLLASLAFATLTSTAPLDSPEEQDPMETDYPPRQRTPEDEATIDRLSPQLTPTPPQNQTLCSAADVACVMAARESQPTPVTPPTDPAEPVVAPAGLVQVRDPSPEQGREATAKEVLQRRQQTLQDATESAGINKLKNNTLPQPEQTQPAPEPSGARPDGTCSAADVECVVGKIKGKFRRGFRWSGYES